MILRYLTVAIIGHHIIYTQIYHVVTTRKTHPCLEPDKLVRLFIYDALMHIRTFCPDKMPLSA